MATIRKRGAYQFQAIIKRKGYANRVRTFESKRDAQQWARDEEYMIDHGQAVADALASKMTLGEALEKYRMEVTPSKKGAPQENCRIDVLLEAPLAIRPLGGIHGRDIALYLDGRLKGAHWRSGKWKGKPVSGQTVRTEIALLSAVFKKARDWGMEGLHNPCHDVNRPLPSKPRTRRLTNEDEERRILDELAQHPNGWRVPFARLATETAARRGELVDLDWADVNLADQTATLRDTKNGTDRETSLSTTAVAILRELGPQPSGRVFRVVGETVSHAYRDAIKAARKRYEAECDAAGTAPDPAFLTNLRLHDLRHEATSRLFEKGLNTMEAASVTGHKTLRMLQRYTHLRAKNIAQKLG